MLSIHMETDKREYMVQEIGAAAVCIWRQGRLASGIMCYTREVNVMAIKNITIAIKANKTPELPLRQQILNIQ